MPPLVCRGVALGATMIATVTAVSSLTHADDFTADDQLVSLPWVSIIDPEFEVPRSRVVWGDALGNLWLAGVSQTTGQLQPANGQGQLIDSGITTLTATLNGAEWAFGGQRGFIVYSKPLADGSLFVHVAAEGADGTWMTGPLRGTLGHYRAVGNMAGDTGGARIISVHDEGGQSYRYHRQLFDPATQQRLDDPTVRGARFVEGAPGIVATVLRDGVQQVALYEPGATQPLLVSADSGNKSLPYLWVDPANGERVAIGNIRTRAIGVYRESEGLWQKTGELRPPTDLPFLQYPKVFTYEDRSYLAVIAAEELTGGPNGDFLGLPGGRCEVWVMAVDPAAPDYRQVSDPSREATRIDLEVVPLADGPAVFYTEVNEALNTLNLRRARTGL